MRSFPTAGLLPKEETLADRFLAQYPTYDGRNTVVAIFDTGVDPGASGLQVTSDGKPKIVDIIDATGSGDVDTSRVVEATADGTLHVSNDRVLRLNPLWKPSVDKKYHVGAVAAYDLFPGPLVTRMKKARREKFDIAQRAAMNAAQKELTEWINANGSEFDAEEYEKLVQKRELEARVQMLKDMDAAYDDVGPVYDCIVFYDGEHWRAAVGTHEGTDFEGIAAMTNYKVEKQYGTFCSESQLNYCVNIYDEGKTLSIVCDAGAHGTHVAGIVAAYHPEQPECNGVAPGAQIISVKIGDTRLGSMETPSALSRAIMAMIEAKCDVVNMSYGEYASEHNAGRIVELAQEMTDRHNVIYVCSAGNNAPALGTVGALGGTSSCTLAIGAYVSPQMMEAEYIMRESDLPANAYTWSSRGPTFDGEVGVTLCAPGAAIAPVPNWTLNKKQLMNGTSMSSPNAAGCIALLLSGLKHKGVEYNPYSIRRGLENTAMPVKNLEVFAQGKGLIQVPTAFEYLTQHGNAFDGTRAFPLSYRVETTIPNGTKGRGIMLRNAQDFAHDRTEALVEVTPQFHKLAKQEDKIRFEMHLKLVASERWIDVGRSVALMHQGRNFKVLVETRNLAPGEHYAEIQAFDASNETRGMVFFIPITVIKPEPLEDGKSLSFEAHLKGGEIRRRFVAVPADATWVDVIISRSQSYGRSTTESNAAAKLFAFHAMQFVPYTRQGHSEFKKFVNLQPDGEVAYSFDVVGGLTLELCVAQFWSTMGDAAIQVDVKFHGIAPDQQSMHITGGETSHRVLLRNSITQEILSPAVKFTRWVQRLRPTKSKITPMNSVRDRLPEERQIFQLMLTYSFTQSEDGTVTPRLPALHGKLYESSFDGMMCMIFDEKKQYMGCADAYEEKISLKKGEYTVLAQVRHEDMKKLESLEQTMLFVERHLKESVSASVYSHPDGAVLKKAAIERLPFSVGSTLAVFMGEPASDKLPKSASSGDLLVGTVHFGKSNGTARGAGRRPGGFPVTYTIGAAEKAKKDETDSVKESKDERPDEEQEQDELREFLLARVKKLAGKKDFEGAWGRLVKQFPESLQVLQAKLHHLDDESERCKQLEDIIVAANAILNRIDQADLAKYFGTRVNECDKQSKLNQDKEKTKAVFIDALQRKARALGDLGARWEEFKTVYKTLGEWVDVDTPTALRATLLHYRQLGHHGLALRLIRKTQALDKAEQAKILSEKELEGELLRALEALGWTHWHHATSQWQRRRAPETYKPF